MTAIAENGTDRAPDGWEIVELGQIADLLNGYAFKSEDYAPSGILNFRVVNIRDQGLINATNDIEFLPPEFTHSHKQYLLSEGDILVVMVGATRGKMGYIPAGILPALMNQNMWRIVPKVRDDVDRRYLYYFLTLVVPKFVHEYSESARGFFKKSDFRSIKVPKPKFKEQQTIARLLDVVQRAIEQQERLIALTTELKKALLHKLFTEGLRGEPQKQTEIGPLPESWKVVPCDDLCEMITVGVVVKPASYYVSNGVPAFRSFNVREDRLEAKDLVYFSQTDNDNNLAKSKLHTGDVLVVRTGYPGTSCVVPKEYDGSNCIDLVIVRPKAGVVRSGFLSRFFNAPAGKSQAVASTHGLAQQHLNVTAVKRTRIPVASLEEQDEIDFALAIVQQKIALIEARKENLTDLFRTLLHQLMTAQIRMDNLDLPELSSPTIS